MKISKEDVVAAKKTYLELREKFHNSNITTIRVAKAPDRYRGAMDCVKILDDVEMVLEDDGGAIEDYYDVFKNSVKVGELIETCGNNGKGKVACSYFEPWAGVKVLWTSDLK